mmetsp:Transcript_47229/g.112363  ORF Transcript_47229/g.112363 Transcript_47229/m.112363 type:complete len:150 (-) Transcript_47229:106-555(-)
MPRQSGRSGASVPTRAAPAPSHGNKAAPPPPAAQPAAPAPAMAPPAPAPAAAPAAGGGMMSGLMGSMMSGMATGVGMSVANRAVDAVMGPRQMEVVHTNQATPATQATPASGGVCALQQEQLMQCTKVNTDMSMCNSYMEALKACQQTA